MSSGRGAGKHDFNEFSAKVEKHIERLPDYAQRAQRQLQRYFPPSDQQEQRAGRDRDHSGADASRRRAGGPPVPAPLARVASELPTVGDMRSKWERYHQPAAKLERRKRRTSRALTLWIVLTLLCALYAGAGFAGMLGAATAETGAVGAVAGAVVFTALSIRSGTRLHRLNRTELPAGPAPPAQLPRPSSRAREPMERLAEAETSLAELLDQLGTSVTGTPAAVPEVSVSDARATADEAAAALRALAARVQAIERAHRNAPAGERAALDTAVATLCEQLDDGLDGYGSLVAAAGRAVAASSAGTSPAREALTDATDRLAGLAMALRELAA